jgi:dolichol kinase
MEYFIISGTLTFLQSLVFVEPLRKRFSFLSFMFLSYDRPEDRPHTVRLVITQVVGMNIALIAIAYLYEFSAIPLDLLAVPLLITAFGDGLAEPFGVLFGRHKYEVKDLFGNRQYTRSIEGSAMVFLSSLITLIAFQDVFPGATLIFMLAVLPFLMTITEAYSPHTWDNPFMYLVGGSSVYFIIMLT